MPELAPAPVVPPATTYRPVSLLAIVGLILGVLSFAIFLFDAVWLLLFLPLPGFLVSLVARRRINRSDGTLAGGMVAAMGIVLSVASGLGYLTVHVTTYWTIKEESRAFADRWTKLLTDGKEVQAFLGTVQPSNRPAPGEELDIRMVRARYPAGNTGFDVFRSAPMPAMVLRYGDKAQWNYLGAKDFQLSAGSYHVKHVYQLTTPEASMDLVVPTRSETRDTPVGIRREWAIDLGNVQPASGTVKVTEYGMQLRDASRDAYKSLENFISAIANGHPETAYAMVEKPDTTKKMHFEELVKALREGVSPGTPSPIKLRPPLYLRDDHENNRFALVLRAVAENGPIDVEFDVSMETPDMTSGWNSWRLSNLTLLSTRHRKNPNDAMAMPPKPPPPTRPF